MFVVKTSKASSEGAPNVSIQIQQQYEENTGKCGLKDINTALQSRELESTSVSNTGSGGDSMLQGASIGEALVKDGVTVSESNDTYRKRLESVTSSQNQVGFIDTGTSKYFSVKEPYASNEVVVCNSSSTQNVHAIQRLLSYNIEKSGSNDESQNAVVNITEIPEVYVDNIIVYEADQVQSNWDRTSIMNNIQGDSGFPMEGLYQNIISSEVDRKQLPVEQIKKLHISPPPQSLKKFTAEDLKAIGTTKEDIMKPCFGRKGKKFTKKEDSKDLQGNPAEGLDTVKVFNTTELENAGTNHAQLEDTSTNHTQSEDTSTNYTQLEDASTNHTQLEDTSTDDTQLEEVSTDDARLGDASTDDKTVSAGSTKEGSTLNADIEKGANYSGSVETLNESCSEEFGNESIVKFSNGKLRSRKRKIDDDGYCHGIKKRQVDKTAKQKKTFVKPEDKEVLVSSKEEDSKTVETTEKDDQKISEPCQIDNDTKHWQDIYKCTHTTDKCVIEIAPILSNIIKDKQCVIEVEVENTLHVKQFQKKKSVRGLNRYCLVVSNPNDPPEMSESHSPKQVNKVERTFNLRKRNKTKSNYKAQPVKQSAKKCQKTSKPSTKNENTAISCHIKSQDEDSRSLNKKDVCLDDEIENQNVENTVKCENESQDSEIGRSESAQRTLKSVHEENMPGGSTLETDVKPKLTGKKKASKALDTNRKKETRKAKRSKAAQNYHTRITEEGQKIFSCKFCTYSTKASRDIAIHYYQHTDERPFQCEICGQAFKGPSNLANHKKQHSSEMYYSCQLCEKQFKDRGNYKQHMRRHIGDKKHVCKHCEMSFVTTSDLKKHQRVHTGEKPYKCDLCTKRFGDKSSLLRHKNLHTQKYRFECEVCGKTFNRRDLCITHVKNVHKIEDHLPINKIFVDEDVSRNYAESEIFTKLVNDYSSTTNEYEDIVPKSAADKVAPKIVKANIVRKYSNEDISEIHIDECSNADYVFANVEHVAHENSSTKQDSQGISSKHVNLEINKKQEKVDSQQDDDANHCHRKPNSKPDNKVISTNSSKTFRKGMNTKPHGHGTESASKDIGTEFVSETVSQTSVFQGSSTSPAQGVVKKPVNPGIGSYSVVQGTSSEIVRQGNSTASVSQGINNSTIQRKGNKTFTDQRSGTIVVSQSHEIKSNSVIQGINTKSPGQKHSAESVRTQHACQEIRVTPSSHGLTTTSIGQAMRAKSVFQGPHLPQQTVESLQAGAQNYGCSSSSNQGSRYQNVAHEKRTVHQAFYSTNAQGRQGFIQKNVMDRNSEGELVIDEDM